MELVRDVIHVAWQAGNAILAHYGKDDVNVSLKGDSSPVTPADFASDGILREKLLQLIPGSSYLSEEAFEGDFEGQSILQSIASGGHCWVVDPLDGTRDFLARTGEFTVNIAFCKNKQIELGVLYAPVRGLTYAAVRGKGSFKVIPSGMKKIVRGRPWELSRLKCLVSRHHPRKEGELLKRLIPHCDIQGCGSALKYGYLAEGVADFVLRRTPTSIWDTAAAQCILEEAGGALWTSDGSPLGIASGSHINPPFLAVSDQFIPEFWRKQLLDLLL